jgi:hypothetical protein
MKYKCVVPVVVEVEADDAESAAIIAQERVYPYDRAVQVVVTDPNGNVTTVDTGTFEIFYVELNRTISTELTVRGRTGEHAAELAQRNDWPLEPRDQWDARKDWRLVVRNDTGDELVEWER